MKSIDEMEYRANESRAQIGDVTINANWPHRWWLHHSLRIVSWVRGRPFFLSGRIGQDPPWRRLRWIQSMWWHLRYERSPLHGEWVVVEKNPDTHGLANMRLYKERKRR